MPRIFPALAVVTASFGISAPAYAADVSVHVVDSVTAAPVAQAAIIIGTSASDQPIVIGTTDGQGRATITGIAPGSYQLTISAAGFADVERDLLIGTKSTALDLGRVALTPQSREIVVTGAGRSDVALGLGVNSYKVDDAAAQSGSALQAMKVLPGISIEREGTVLLRGSDRVTILIDGKPSAATGIGNQRGLDSLPAANIDRIEVITNPSARYGAGGSAGIINIVMKKERARGWSGQFGLKGGVGALGRRKPDLPTDLGSFDFTPKISPTFNLRHSGQNADYYAAGEFLLQRKLPQNEFTTRIYAGGPTILSQVPENRKQDLYMLRVGTDQRLNARDTLSVSATFDLENHLDQAQVPYINAATGVRNRFWFWRENEQTGHVSAAANFRRDFAEAGRNLTLRAEFIRGWEDETYRLNEESAVRIGTDQTRIVALENTVPVSIDYVHPTDSGRIEAGAKFQHRWLPVRYDVVRGTRSVIYPGLGDTSMWKETIFAGYANLVRETKAITIEAGVRIEQTQVAYEIDDTNIYYPGNDAYGYFRIFPNVRLTWAAGPQTDISLFYNKRVDRPGEQELRVFPKYDDPELLKVGNPYLRPQFSTAYELSVRQNWGALTGSLSVFHRRITDAFQRIYAIDQTSTVYPIINKIYQNTGNARNTGAELVAAWKAPGGIKLNGSLAAFRIDRDPASVRLLFPYVRTLALPASRDFTWDGKLGLEAPLGSATAFQISATYYGARDVAQGRQEARSAIDLGITRQLDKHWKLSLSATDIFNRFGTNTRVRGVGFDAIYENYYESQTVMLALEYKL